MINLYHFLVIVALTFTSSSVAGDTAFSKRIISFQKPTDSELHCLAQNIYFESRSDNMAGQFAVADVVLNRVLDERYPTTICKVVQEGPLSKWHLEQGRQVPIKHKCQFSWYCDGKSDEPVDSKTWIKSLFIADLVLTESYKDITEGALWYHADYILPYWADQLEFVTQIDDHVFYK